MFNLCKILLLSLLALQAHAQTVLSGSEALRTRLGLDSSTFLDMQNIRIAVLDNGFEGYVPGIGMLPDSAVLIAGPVNPQLAERHGLSMAQTAWAVAGSRTEGPKFFLVNSNGLSNFRAAIDFVTSNNIDIVLYAQTWDYGGNFNGTGFIDALVGRAVSSGVTWINASGDSHGMIYDGAIALEGAQVILPGDANSLNINTSLDDTDLTVSISWNDYTDDAQSVSTKDLNTVLESASGDVLARAERRQGVDTSVDPLGTRFARETLNLRVNRGSYQLRLNVLNVDDWSRADHVRVLVSSNKPGSVTLLEATNRYELMAPADAFGVVTVGDGSAASAAGPTLDGRQKPEVIVADSRVAFTDGIANGGTSNAAAMAAGAAAVLAAQDANLRGPLLNQALIAFLQSQARVAPSPPLPPCHSPLAGWFIDSAVRAHLPRRFRAVLSASGRQIVLVSTLPEQLEVFATEAARGASSREHAFFVMAAPTSGGYHTGLAPVVTATIARADVAQVPPGYVEVRFAPLESVDCPRAP